MVTDPLPLTIFIKGGILIIPDSEDVLAVPKKLFTIRIDINIPKFKWRIMHGDPTLYTYLKGQDRLKGSMWLFRKDAHKALSSC